MNYAEIDTGVDYAKGGDLRVVGWRLAARVAKSGMYNERMILCRVMARKFQPGHQIKLQLFKISTSTPRKYEADQKLRAQAI